MNIVSRIKAFELYPIILSMANWADKWMDQGLGKPLEYRHKACGHKFEPVMVCSVCREPLHAKQVQVSAGRAILLIWNKSKTGLNLFL